MCHARMVILGIALALATPMGSHAQVSRWPKSEKDVLVTLDVEEALEEGPIVCRVVLMNTSGDSLLFSATRAHGNVNDGAFCEVEAGWKVRRLVQSGYAGMMGTQRIELPPGATLSHRFVLHHQFLSIPAGKATLRFGWHVDGMVDAPAGRGPGTPKKFEIEHKKVIEVRPATAENVTAVLRRLEAELPKHLAWNESHEGWNAIQVLHGCRHRQFVPLILRALEESPTSPIELVDTLYESFPSADEAFAASLEYLSRPNPAAACDVFVFWSQQRFRFDWKERKRQDLADRSAASDSKADKEFYLGKIAEIDEEWKASQRHGDARPSPAQWARLRAVKNVWVRALVYYYAPDQCPPEWVASLLGDLKGLSTPPAGFDERIARLDGDDFRDREDATAELLATGPAIANHLWALRGESLPAETRRRVALLKERIAEPTASRHVSRTLQFLAASDAPGNVAMLDALRHSPRPTMFGVEAQKAVELAQKNKTKR